VTGRAEGGFVMTGCTTWRRSPPALAAAAAVLAVVLSAGCGTNADRPVGSNPVVRDILVDKMDPPGVPGRTLSLVKYTIAPGAQLPAHVHPGIQLASIQSGTLTYTVISGSATVRRGTTATGETVTGPATITLGPGDDVTEVGDMVHFGANKTDRPVVIMATLLTEDGRDLAITVPQTTSSRP
jgi:hypothetical protein